MHCPREITPKSTVREVSCVTDSAAEAKGRIFLIGQVEPLIEIDKLQASFFLKMYPFLGLLFQICDSPAPTQLNTNTKSND